MAHKTLYGSGGEAISLVSIPDINIAGGTPLSTEQALRKVDYDAMWEIVEKRVKSQGTTLAQVWDPSRGRPKPTSVTDQTLRMMASRNEWIKAIVKTRQNQVKKSKWSIVPKDEDDTSPSVEALCEKITKLLERPSLHGSRPSGRSWKQYIAEAVQDILVLDRSCTEKEWTLDKWIAAFYPVDGATIAPNMDERGGYHADAYVQVVDGQVTARFGMEDLMVIMDNPQTDVRFAGYGFSPLEGLIVSVSAELYASKYNSSYFEKGAVPEGMINLGPEAAPEDVNAFRLYWMNEIMGRPWAIPILGGSTAEWIPWRASNKDMEFGCVPLDTEILTRQGWKHHDEVRVGDETIGYNPDTGYNEWTRIKNIYHYEDAPIVKMGNQRWSCRCTPGHRWMATWPNWKKDKMFRKFVETDSIRTHHRLIMAAPAEGGDSDITPTEAALIAWLVCDGNIQWPVNGVGRKGKRALSAHIYQKKETGRTALVELLEDVPHTVHERRDGCTTFRLRSPWFRDLWARAGLYERSLSDLVLELSSESLEAFLDAAIMAEGHTAYETGEVTTISQNRGEVLDAIVLAVYLRGYRPKVRKETIAKLGTKPNCDVVLAQPVVTGQSITIEDDGCEAVWCPETELGTWTMRQGDQITLTGNSYNEWLLKKMCANFQMSPKEMGLVEDVNRSTAESEDTGEQEKGVEPMLELLEDSFNLEIIGEYGLGVGDYVEFKFDEEHESEEAINARFSLMVPEGAATRQEWREALSMDPGEDEGLDEFLVQSEVYPLPSGADLEALGAANKQAEEAKQMEMSFGLEEKEHGRQMLESKAKAKQLEQKPKQIPAKTGPVKKVFDKHNPQLLEVQEDAERVFEKAQGDLMRELQDILGVPLVGSES